MHTACARALTENVSRTGILVQWLDDIPLPEVGGRLTLDVHLPRNPEMAPPDHALQDDRRARDSKVGPETRGRTASSQYEVRGSNGRDDF